MSFNNDRRRNDTVVVGGGLAGLTAAIYLARGGSRVRLMEKAREVGGRAQTRRQDGFLFNLGPHAPYQGAEAQEILDEFGVSYKGAGPPIWKALTVHNNTLYRVPAGPRTFLSNDLLGVRERLELMAALLNVMRASPAAAAAQTAQEWMHRRAASQRVRDFMFMVGRTSTYSSTMREMSAEVFLLQLQLTLRHGVLYLDGGWQTLAYMLMLERLSPRERAAFLLRELFEYDYDELADILDTSYDNCRQLVSRARRKLAVDGGGKAAAAMVSIHGADRVSRFCLRLVDLATPDMKGGFASLNGQTAFLIYDAEGTVDTVTLARWDGDTISELLYVRNPDKLQAVDAAAERDRALPLHEWKAK